MFPIQSLSKAADAIAPVTDVIFIGLSFLLLLASWGLIVLCERLMEDRK